MNQQQSIECTIEFTRKGHSRSIGPNPPEPPPPTGKLPRVTRLLALAHRLAGYIRDGRAVSQLQLAQLGHVTEARMSQIFNLLNLAPDIQEEILFLAPTQGRAPVLLIQLQPIASTLDWSEQRAMWNVLRASGPR